jgi:hypothetical protein
MMNMTDLRLPSPRLLWFLLSCLLPFVFSFLPLFGGALLGLLFLIIVFLGRRRDVFLSYVAGIPGGMELLLILVIELFETVEIFGTLEAFLHIFNDFGSDTTPMTPCTVVGSVSSRDRCEMVHRRDAYNEVLPLISTRVL